MLQIIPDKELLWQQQIINITPSGSSKRVILQLRYIERNDLWYIFLYDGQTGNPICTFVPVIVSGDKMVNLLAPFEHKNIGYMFCVSTVDDPSTENPSKSNWDDFALYWGGVDE